MNDGGATSVGDVIARCARKLTSIRKAMQPAELAEMAQEYFEAPRCLGVAERYIRHELPAGSYHIYGIGSEISEIAYAVLTERSDTNVVGFVDRRADEVPLFHGMPVRQAEQLSFKNRERVLLAHHHREPQMVRCLLDAGMSEEMIERVYTSSGYARLALETIKIEFLANLPEQASVCQIKCIDLERNLLPDAALRHLFAGHDTICLRFGRPEWFHDPGGDEYDCLMSVDLLEAALKQLVPTVVYLNTTPHVDGVWMGVLVREWLPHARIVQEVSDWAFLFTDERLERMGFGGDLTDMQRQGEAFATGGDVDLVVHKNGGLLWGHAQAAFTSPDARVFPVAFPGNETAVDPPAHRQNELPEIKVLFAGSLPRPGTDIHPDLDYVPLFESAVADGGVTLDLFNANHQAIDLDAHYEAYLRAWSDDSIPIRYFRGIALAQIVCRMKHYDFGWHVTDHRKVGSFEPVTAVGLGNKFCTYIEAGLPVLIDDRYEYICELIERFNAGVIVASKDVNEIGVLIKQADRSVLREGALALREEMHRQNSQALEVIRTHMFGE